MIENTADVLFRLIKDLKISVTRSSIISELNIHPQSNSLRAISDVLSNWNILNGAYEMSIDRLISDKSLTPFIAHSSINDGEFIFVHNINHQFATISNNRFNKSVIEIDKFKENYNGVVLIAEKTEISGEVGYRSKRIEEIISQVRLPFAIFSLISMVTWFILIHHSEFNSMLISVLLVIKGIGLVVSLALLGHTIDANSPLVRRICLKTNSNCTAILHSDAAKITTWLSWSEIGFFYFVGTLLAVILSITNSNFLLFLFLLTLCSLPYTFFSIYYQWKIAKEWCILCCLIQILLWLEFAAFFILHNTPPVILSIVDIIELTFCFLLPVLLWVILKPTLVKGRKSELLARHLNFFKYNEEMFGLLMNSQPAHSLLDDEYLFLTGTCNEDLIVTLISNPYCSACAIAHKKLGWVLKRDDIRLQLIFVTTDYQDEVLGNIMGLMMDGDKQLAIHAISDWYEKKHKTRKDWIKKYPAKLSSDSVKILRLQSEWCEGINVDSTPTILINGKRLPDSYSPEDIKYLL